MRVPVGAWDRPDGSIGGSATWCGEEFPLKRSVRSSGVRHMPLLALQRPTELVLGALGGDVDHLRPLPQGAVGLGVEGGPLLLVERGDGLRQLRTHPRSDGEADAPARFVVRSYDRVRRRSRIPCYGRLLREGAFAAATTGFAPEPAPVAAAGAGGLAAGIVLPAPLLPAAATALHRTHTIASGLTCDSTGLQQP